MEPAPPNTPGRRLRGKALFLSASVPDRPAVQTRLYEGPLPDESLTPDRDLRIRLAVTAIARAIFSEGGQLVFGGHPAISPHVAMVAAEYFPPQSTPSALESADESEDRRPIVVYQSRAYEDVIIDDVRLMQRLGQATIRMTPAAAGERFDPRLRGKKQCQKSLAEMRGAMVSRENIVAMVCIGGMDGIFDEFFAFGVADSTTKFRRPVFVLASTGGASLELSRLPEAADRIHVIDEGSAEDYRAAHFPPYQFFAQRIVDVLVPDDGGPLP